MDSILLNDSKGGWEKVAHYSNSLQAHDGDSAVGKMLADMVHYGTVCHSASLEHTSVLDSGAARHVHPYIIIADLGNKTRLTSFTCEDIWTDGLGYASRGVIADLPSNPIDLCIEDTGYIEGVDGSLFSMGKMIRKGWTFEFELSGLMGW